MRFQILGLFKNSFKIMILLLVNLEKQNMFRVESAISCIKELAQPRILRPSNSFMNPFRITMSALELTCNQDVTRMTPPKMKK